MIEDLPEKPHEPWRQRLIERHSTSRPAIAVEILVAILCFGTVITLPFVIRGFWVHLLLLALFFIGLTVFIWLSKGSWRSYGLSSPGRWLRTISLALLLVFAVNLLVNTIVLPAVVAFAGAPPDLSIFYEARRSPVSLTLLLAVTWTWAAFGEELFFRGYLLNRLADLLGRSRAGWALGLLGSSALFGLCHFYQGLAGILLTGIVGLLAGLIYLAMGRNLWVPILWHGLTDTFTLLIIFIDKIDNIP